MATSISRPSLTEFATSNKLLQSLESQWFYKLAKLSKNEKWPRLARKLLTSKYFEKPQLANTSSPLDKDIKNNISKWKVSAIFSPQDIWYKKLTHWKPELASSLNGFAEGSRSWLTVKHMADEGVLKQIQIQTQIQI